MALTGHQPIHTDVGANCIRGLCAPLRAGHARTGLANPATGPNTATVALATFVAFKAVGSATCQQRSRRGAFEEQLTGIGCTHSRGWLNQVKEHGRTGRDCSAARGGSTAAQYRRPKYPLRSRARRPGSARLRYPANKRAWLRVPVSPATGWPSRHQAGHAVPMIGRFFLRETRELGASGPHQRDSALSDHTAAENPCRACSGWLIPARAPARTLHLRPIAKHRIPGGPTMSCAVRHASTYSAHRSVV